MPWLFNRPLLFGRSLQENVLMLSPAAIIDGTTVFDRCAEIERVDVVAGRLVISVVTPITSIRSEHTLHPQWLRDRSLESGDVDPVNRQRLFEPLDVDVDLVVESAEFTRTSEDRTITVCFSDARTTRHTADSLLVAIGELSDPDALPTATPWAHPPASIPTLDWTRVHEPAAVLDALTAFHRSGWFVITRTPTAAGSLHEIATTFGRISATNFGVLFDVETNPDATDLAYTPAGLSAHLDQPYRQPTPGLQFLHTLVNEAEGGESTVVDGLAAVTALRCHDAAGFDLLSQIAVEYRYDIGTDVVINRAPIIELDVTGTVRHIRFSPRLDFAPVIDPNVLDHWYRARRWLASWLNDPEHQLTFKMNAGDVLVVDNHRVLHGRTPFDPSTGRRHLQGCYIDHDGPASMWRLMRRQSVVPSSEAAAPSAASITA
jgi:gamma-butyrobetaine dioxygenase